jgi:2-dehydrotetronate isomerase
LVKARLDATGIELALLNAPPGDLADGDRGLASIDGRQEEFIASIEQALTYAEVTGCPRIHVLAGCPTDGGASERFVDRIGWAADRTAPAGIDILIEPMNLRDVPGYLLMSSKQAERVIAQVGRPNVKLQFDTYHLQIQEGDLLEGFQRCLPVIGHVQFSSLPGRHEPDEGEVAHDWLFEQFDRAGYTDWVGCEYRPRAGTLDCLGWAQAYGITKGS